MKKKKLFSSKMNVDNPGELMEALLKNREARKFLGDSIEDAISKSQGVRVYDTFAQKSCNVK